MRELRRNTAVIVSVGPFLDKTDGVTLETSLTITNERITMVADTDAGSAPTIILDNVTGATSGTANDLNYITGQDNAMMQLELAAADTNRLGRARITITDAANHLPVVEDFMILREDEYDRKYSATSKGVVYGTAATGTLTATSFTTSLTVAADELNGRLLTFLTGALAGQQRQISDTAVSGGLLTFAATNGFTGAPSNGDVFIVT